MMVSINAIMEAEARLALALGQYEGKHRVKPTKVHAIEPRYLVLEAPDHPKALHLLSASEFGAMETVIQRKLDRFGEVIP